MYINVRLSLLKRKIFYKDEMTRLFLSCRAAESTQIQAWSRFLLIAVMCCVLKTNSLHLQLEKSKNWWYQYFNLSSFHQICLKRIHLFSAIILFFLFLLPPFPFYFFIFWWRWGFKTLWPPPLKIGTFFVCAAHILTSKVKSLISQLPSSGHWSVNSQFMNIIIIDWHKIFSSPPLIWNISTFVPGLLTPVLKFLRFIFFLYQTKKSIHLSPPPRAYFLFSFYFF